MWRETQARPKTTLFCSTHTPHPMCQNMLSVGPVVAANWEIRAASWQLAAMLEASSSKKIYEGKRKKEVGESSLYLFRLRIKTPTEQSNWYEMRNWSEENWDEVRKRNENQPQRVLLIFTSQTLCSFASEWPATDFSFTGWRLGKGGMDRERGCEKDDV